MAELTFTLQLRKRDSHHVLAVKCPGQPELDYERVVDREYRLAEIATPDSPAATLLELFRQEEEKKYAGLVRLGLTITLQVEDLTGESPAAT